MIAADEDALVCDLAETYGVFDYRALPAKLLATLAVGLRENARIKLILSGMKVPQETLLLAAAVDRLAFLAWAKTKDGQSGIKRPPSVVALLLGDAGKERSGSAAYRTPQDFEAARTEILRKVSQHGN